MTPRRRPPLPPEHDRWFALRGLWLVIVVSVVACWVWLQVSGCSSQTRRDPPVLTAATETEAMLTAMAHAAEKPGSRWWRTYGTSSMEPLIRGVVYLTTDAAPFGELREGEIVIYRAEWALPSDPPVCHRLIKRDGYGWIVSGDNVRPDIDPTTGRNRVSEASYRVTPANYLGRVVGIYRWRQSGEL